MATHFSILAWRNPMDREAWWATVHGVTKSQIRLSNNTEEDTKVPNLNSCPKWHTIMKVRLKTWSLISGTLLSKHAFKDMLWKCQSLSHVRLFVTSRTITRQAPRSMQFCRQEYWSGLPFPSPGDLPNTVIELGSLALQVDSLPAELAGKPKYWIHIAIVYIDNMVFPGGSDGKESACSAGDMGWIPGLGRVPG